MKHIKKILYIHGINSSGNTGKTLKRIFKEKYGDVEVIAPSIPANYFEASKVVDMVMRNESPDLVMGTSLGGFMTLTTKAPCRIAINPTLCPSKTLPLIGTPNEISESYVEIEKQIKDLLDSEDRNTVFGVFGDNDKVVNHRAEFEKRYLKDHIFTVPGGEHQMKEEEFKKYIFPIVESIDDNCRK
ncbi:MAG: hypothetical protein J1E16_05965 [Muribaculaceae bacterium]|nr:hypothetical protein [Muribaculaceae bacterium]